MNDEPQAHADLRRLFDATAAAASGPTLTKLAARAADVPQTLRKRRFAPRWAWGPAVAGAILALGGPLALRATIRQAATAPRSGLGSAAPVLSVAAPTASARAAQAAAPRPITADEASEGPGLLGDADEGARFDVSGPEADRDLDAWLAATKEWSGGT